MSKETLVLEKLSTTVLKGVSLAAERLVLKKRQEDGELIFTRDGQIVHVKARDIQLPSEQPE